MTNTRIFNFFNLLLRNTHIFNFLSLLLSGISICIVALLAIRFSPTSYIPHLGVVLGCLFAAAGGYYLAWSRTESNDEEADMIEVRPPADASVEDARPIQ